MPRNTLGPGPGQEVTSLPFAGGDMGREAPSVTDLVQVACQYTSTCLASALRQGRYGKELMPERMHRRELALALMQYRGELCHGLIRTLANSTSPYAKHARTFLRNHPKRMPSPRSLSV